MIFRAFNDSGTEVSSTTTAEDGSWSMIVPEGSYDILLDVETLPDGVSLRNPDKNPASVTLIDGSSKSTLFPLGEAEASSAGGNTVVQLMVDGLKLGLIIAMCAIGLSLIYGTTGLTNFAHGEAVTFGAVMAYLLNNAGVFGVPASRFWRRSSSYSFAEVRVGCSTARCGGQCVVEASLVAASWFRSGSRSSSDTSFCSSLAAERNACVITRFKNNGIWACSDLHQKTSY